jgi:long-subunit fatty acid transport protein
MSGGLDAITPAFGFQISPMFSIGAAGNILINGYTEEFNKTYPGLHNGTDNYTHDYKFSGFNFNAGALISTQKFNLGLMLRFPFTFTQTHKITNDWNFTANGGNSGTEVVTDPSTDISMPMMFGIGAAIKPTDKLTLAFDFESRPYSKLEVEQAGYSGNAGYRDCQQFRVGLEYVMAGSNMVFPIRLGFRTDPKTYNGNYGDGTDTSQAVGKVFTGGFGLIMGKVNLDLAYEYGITNIADVSNSGYTYKADEVTHTILASCIFHF